MILKRLEVGQRVRAKSNAGMLGEIIAVVETGRPEPAYRVRFANGTRMVSWNSIVADEVAKDPREQLLEHSWAGAAELRLLLTGLRLRQQNLTDQLLSLRAARLEHYPYQYKPLLKFLESDHQRVLIADEVGLGKTIEAGIIMSELAARQELRRVLVVVPSNLRLKWQRELRDRFDEDFELRDTPWVRNVILSDLGDREPPAFKAIVSVEGMRRLARQFEENRPALDLLIIDEAHRLRNESTLSFRLGRALSDGADGMLMCSATPMQTKDKDLHNLLRILLGDGDEGAGTYSDFVRDLEANRPLVRCSALIMSETAPAKIASALELAAKSLPPDREQDRLILKAEAASLRASNEATPARRSDLLVTINRLNFFGGIITRTRKRDVIKDRPERVARLVPVEFTPQEMNVYNSITEAAGEAVRRYGAWSGASLAMISRARQAASCLAVFLDKLNADTETDDEANASLGAELTAASDEGSDEIGEFKGDAPGDLLERVRKQVSRVNLPVDSKLHEFLVFLEELQRDHQDFKVVVFSTFRGTVYYLSKKLQERSLGHGIMTGLVVDPKEREKVIERFENDPTCHVLLTTEVGGEGIDLQFCDTLVNYDLPWNPMVVEQRIGRLDRLGQKSNRIRIVAFNVKGTIESRIVERLYDRIELFQNSVGPLEVILGEKTQKLALELLILSPDEQAQRLQEARVAIENARLQAEHLDREAINLLGDDAYYEQRLAEIERTQGNIAADLAAFLRAWLTTNFSHAALVEGPMPGVMRLTFDSKLVQWLQERNTQRDLAAFARRYAAAGSVGLDVTFEQAIAESRHRIEFITSRHSFARAVGAAIDARVVTQVTAFAVKLQSTLLPPGDYLLAVALQDISGIRPRRELVAAGASLADGTMLPEDIANSMLLDVVRSGMPFTHFSVKSEDLALVADHCEAELFDRAYQRAELLRMENLVFVERRIASMQRWFSRRIERADGLSSTHADERVRRMNAGLRESFKARLEQEISVAHARMQVEHATDIKAFVLAKVSEEV